MAPSLDDPRAGQGLVIAVAGAGASGTLATVHLLREAAGRRIPLRVALIDRLGRHGLGRAYATTHPAHLLNSPVGRMSALAGDPGHLARWAERAGLGPDGFLARRDYGRYLGEVLTDAERAAAPAARVSRITGEVVAIRRTGRRRGLQVQLAGGVGFDADLAVVATGGLPSAPPGPVPGGGRYISDPWAPGALDRVADGSPVAVLGTGLTMLDVAIAVTSAHPGTVVHAISRHALLPQVHRWPRAATVPGPGPVISPPPGQLSLPGLVRMVRAGAARYPGDWQDIVDALRPQVPGLWAQLAEADQRLFLRHLARYWEVHRHRIPPATAARVSALRASGRLSVLRGRVVAASDQPGGMRLWIGHGGPATELTAGWLINGTGPGTDVTATSDPLLRHLLGHGLARPDSLRLGLDADARGALRDTSGRAAGDIVTLGPLLRGLRYETTAIPEIRDQAAALARLLLGTQARAAAAVTA